MIRVLLPGTLFDFPGVVLGFTYHELGVVPRPPRWRWGVVTLTPLVLWPSLPDVPDLAVAATTRRGDDLAGVPLPKPPCSRHS